MMTDDTRDRVIALEVRVQSVSKQLEELSTKITEIHGVMLQAKGARWAILGMAAIAGYMASWAHKLFPLFGMK